MALLLRSLSCAPGVAAAAATAAVVVAGFEGEAALGDGAPALEEPPPPPAPHDDAPPLKRVVAWLQEQGAWGLGNVEWRLFDKGAGERVRGLATRRAFSSGSKMFAIPGNLSMYLGSELLHNQSGFEGAGSDEDRLALHLAHEWSLGARSAWAPYVAMLPGPALFQRFHPTYAAESLLDRFSFLPVVDRIREHQRTLEQKGRRFSQSYLPGVGLEELRWASTIVLSRAFGQEEFLPFLDLMNGDLEPSVEVFCDDQLDCDSEYYPDCPEPDCNFYEVFAARDLAKGEELTITYGTPDNEYALFSWGFLFPDNPERPTALNESLCSSPPVRRALSEAEGREQLPILRLFQALAREQCWTHETESDDLIADGSASQEL